jgi:hypothetical protein
MKKYFDFWTRSIVTLLAVFIVTGCAQPTLENAKVLICEIHEVKPEACGALGCLFNPGFRMTVTFLDSSRSEIALGDVFGSQTMLQKTQIKLSSDATRDPNVVQFENIKTKPPKYEELILLNTVSGQLYYHSVLDSVVQNTYYAHCSPK